MSWLHSIATRLRLMVSRRAAESRFNEEIDFHVDMEAARLARELGVDPGEARTGGIAYGVRRDYAVPCISTLLKTLPLTAPSKSLPPLTSSGCATSDAGGSTSSGTWSRSRSEGVEFFSFMVCPLEEEEFES